MKISLILPIYNEQAILEEVLSNYKADLKGVCEKIKGTYEIIAVNDGCTDASPDILVKEGRLNRSLRIINLEQRYGKQAAITAGMDAATGDVLILADVDLLNPIGIIERMVEQHKQGSAIVYAYRDHIGFEKTKMWFSDRMVGLATRLFGVAGIYTGKANLQLFGRDVADVIISLPNKNKLMRAMDNWTGFTIDKVNYVSGYNKTEIVEKVAEAKARDKRNGIVLPPRSTAREHTASKVYSLTSALASVAFLVFWIILASFTTIGLIWSIVMAVSLVALVLVAVLLYARSLMIKRLGVVYNQIEGSIYKIKSLMN